MSETTHTAYIHCSLSWTAVNYMFWNLNFVWMWTRSTVKLDTSWLELMQQIVYWRCMLISTHSTYLLFVRFTLYPRHRLHTRYMKYDTYTCICAKTDLQLVYTELSEHMVLACTRADCNVYNDAVLCSCCTLSVPVLHSVSSADIVHVWKSILNSCVLCYLRLLAVHMYIV